MGIFSFLRTSKTEALDKAGAFASSLCAVHCALCALIPAAFGLIGLDFLMSEHSELILTLIAVVFALGAMVLSWRKRRSLLIVGLLSCGIIALLTSRVLEMGAHHDHHEEHHAVHEDDHKSTSSHEHEHEKKHSSEKTTEHKEEALGLHQEDESPMHAIGGVFGVFGGVFIFFGHLLNIRRNREEVESCCSTSEKIPVS